MKLFSKTRSKFWENFFFIPCLVFDVWRHLLTSFCNISLIWPLNHLFEQLDLIFTKYISRVKLLNVTLGTFWQNIYLIPCRVFDLWRHLLTSFCSISLIFPLNCLFEQLNLIFRRCLNWLKLFNMIKGTFSQNIFGYHVSILMDVINEYPYPFPSIVIRI